MYTTSAKLNEQTGLYSLTITCDTNSEVLYEVDGLRDIPHVRDHVLKFTLGKVGKHPLQVDYAGRREAFQLRRLKRGA